ncbi:MAG: hypothetical protein HY913_16525 [Desulfomonile tiedjei]|nr:hypothetical protein [Desulfomonile tiedjei]
MDDEWQKTFRGRRRRFEARRPPREDEIAVAIKIRVKMGCFHREHSPNAYRIIDASLRKLSGTSEEMAFEEHESGPELLVYLAVVTAGITLAKSVVDLVTTIIRARAEGIKTGDTRSAPLELIVRRVDREGEFSEEVVLRVGHTDHMDEELIEQSLSEALGRLAKKDHAGNR